MKVVRKIRKLFLSPRLFINDAFFNFLKKNQGKIFKNTSVPSFSKLHEHLMAVDLISKENEPIGVLEKRVYILTGIPFWRNSLGNQARIMALANYLKEHYDLTVIYTGLISFYDAKLIQSTDWGRHLKFLKNISTVLDFEFQDKAHSISNRDTYIGNQKLKEFLTKYPAKALIVEYITQHSYIDGIDMPSLKIIDTHDIMNVRMQTYHDRGRKHHIIISEQEELNILNYYDYVVAIQKNEFDYLKARISEDKIVLSQHALTVRNNFKERDPRRIVYVAGKNPANLDSINWFLHEVWPQVIDSGLTVHIFGQICSLISKSIDSINNTVFLHGEVADVNEVYSSGDIVINPCDSPL